MTTEIETTFLRLKEKAGFASAFLVAPFESGDQEVIKGLISNASFEELHSLIKIYPKSHLVADYDCYDYIIRSLFKKIETIKEVKIALNISTAFFKKNSITNEDNLLSDKEFAVQYAMKTKNLSDVYQQILDFYNLTHQSNFSDWYDFAKYLIENDLTEDSPLLGNVMTQLEKLASSPVDWFVVFDLGLQANKVMNKYFDMIFVSMKNFREAEILYRKVKEWKSNEFQETRSNLLQLISYWAFQHFVISRNNNTLDTLLNLVNLIKMMVADSKDIANDFVVLYLLHNVVEFASVNKITNVLYKIYFILKHKDRFFSEDTFNALFGTEAPSLGVTQEKLSQALLSCSGLRFKQLLVLWNISEASSEVNPLSSENRLRSCYDFYERLMNIIALETEKIDVNKAKSFLRSILNNANTIDEHYNFFTFVTGVCNFSDSYQKAFLLCVNKISSTVELDQLWDEQYHKNDPNLIQAIRDRYNQILSL